MKLFLLTAVAAIAILFTVPAQAQFGGGGAGGSCYYQ